MAAEGQEDASRLSETRASRVSQYRTERRGGHECGVPGALRAERVSL